MNISASPFHAGKGAEREAMLIQRARDSNVAVLFCNLVGGQDELVFDGHSVAIGVDGELIARAPQFEESFTVLTLDPGAIFARRLQDARHRPAVRLGSGRSVPTLARLGVPARADGALGGPLAEVLAPEEELYRALVLGRARLRAEERLQARGGGAVRRDRLCACGARRRRRARRGVRDLRVDALAATRRRARKADARAIAENLGSEFHELRSRTR